MLTGKQMTWCLALTALMGLSSSVALAEDAEKCGKCKTKNTLQLVEPKLSDKTLPSKKSEQRSASNSSNVNDDQSSDSEQSGIEKGNDRENDMRRSD